MFANDLTLDQAKTVCQGEKHYILTGGDVVKLVFRDANLNLCEKSLNPDDHDHRKLIDMVFGKPNGVTEDKDLRKLFTLCSGCTRLDNQIYTLMF